MTEQGKHEILTAFPAYMAAHEQLEIEYYQIRQWPFIGFVRQMINLHKRGKLNKEFQEKMRSWGL